MTMFRTIVVPLDGSELAERALPYAQTLANAGGGRVVLVRTQPASKAELMDVSGESASTEIPAEDYLADARLRLPGLPVQTMIEYGHAGDAIVQTVHEQGADTIVMTTHGRSGFGRWLYGSVADHVLRHAMVPVLLVPAACPYAWSGTGGSQPAEPRRILVPLDGSAFGEAILPAAGRLAALLDAEIDLLRAVEMPTSGGYPYAESLAYVPELLETQQAAAQGYVEDVAARLRAEGRGVTARTEVGWPGTVIASVARERQAGVIAMATHGRSGLARVVLGSVATATLQQACAPLLLVRPAHLDEAA
jgi:nucleotide-binding universal stress UspA family protein